MISSSSEWLPTLVSRDLRSCCFAYGINLCHLSLRRTIFALGLNLFRGGKLFRGMEHPPFLLRPFFLFASCPCFPFSLGSGPEKPVLAFWLVAFVDLLDLLHHLSRLTKETAFPDLGCSLPHPLPLHRAVGMKGQWQTALGRDLCSSGLG